MLTLVVVAALAAGGAWYLGYLPATASNSDVPPTDTNVAIETTEAAAVDIGKDLYAPPADFAAAPPARKFALGADPVVIPESQLSCTEKVELPSQREGVILFIGTDVSDEEWAKLATELRIETRVRGEVQKFRKLREGDEVAAGQLLAVIDDRVAFAVLAIKKAKIVAATADMQASDATYNESKAQHETVVKLYGQGRGASSKEEVNTRMATMIKYKYETAAKATAIEQAKKEAEQAETVLGQHEIRSSIAGVIKTIYKYPGEAVKGAAQQGGGAEPIMQIINLKKLRAEGMVDEQQLPYLRKDMQVVVEHPIAQRPLQTLVGHLQEVTGVAVTRGDNPRIVSASLDGTVRVWDRTTGSDFRILKHPAAVKAVACTPATAKANLCLSGGADGVGRLWDLDGTSPKPLRVLDGKHRGAINCAAFSPDGAVCATGGDDRDINVWDVATGALKYKLTGHGGAVTGLQFLPKSQLLSAGKDKTLRLWKLGTEAGRQEESYPGRSGDVAQLAASPHGRHVLFDPYQSKALRVLSLPEGMTEGVVKNPASSGPFTALALFAPDGQTVLTAAEGRLQLWRSPLSTGRAYVLRQLETEERAEPTSAAFAPDGSFLVAGTKDKNVLVWPTPDKQEIEQLRTAKIVYIDPALASSHQTRVWCELDDASGLQPGATVTVVGYPKK
jgi:WD40 repeat protein/biotin carboxyl carrier protein